MIGRVSLVGAGPGDPELLTVRAMRRLSEADVILHDALLDPRVLALAPQARRVDVGKRAGKHQMSQRSIERLLVRLARRGWHVVRLKGGDPFVFGRGGEEAIALEQAGVPYEIVPGLSSALTAPALCGIPVTHRGAAAGFLVVSGHDLDVAAPLLRGVRPGAATVVVLMARERRTAIGRLLLDAGWSGATPVAVVQNASLPAQGGWHGTLAQLVAGRDRILIDPAAPTVLVFGPTAALASQLAAGTALLTTALEEEPAKSVA